MSQSNISKIKRLTNQLAVIVSPPPKRGRPSNKELENKRTRGILRAKISLELEKEQLDQTHKSNDNQISNNENQIDFTTGYYRHFLNK